MKITKSVPIENAEYIIALMDKLEFKEIDRVATGGYMSPEKLIITFEGFSDNYHENDYVKITSVTDFRSTFVSLKHPNGYWGDLDGYKKFIEDSKVKIDINTL